MPDAATVHMSRTDNHLLVAVPGAHMQGRQGAESPDQRRREERPAGANKLHPIDFNARVKGTDVAGEVGIQPALKGLLSLNVKGPQSQIGRKGLVHGRLAVSVLAGERLRLVLELEPAVIPGTSGALTETARALWARHVALILLAVFLLCIVLRTDLNPAANASHTS